MFLGILRKSSWVKLPQEHAKEYFIRNTVQNFKYKIVILFIMTKKKMPLFYTLSFNTFLVSAYFQMWYFMHMFVMP